MTIETRQAVQADQITQITHDLAIERSDSKEMNTANVGLLETFQLGQDPSNKKSLGFPPSQERQEYVSENLQRAVVEKNNREILSCIDGRKCLCCILNAAGNELDAMLCGRQAGGSLIYDIMTILMDFDVPGVLDIDDNASIDEIFASIEKAFNIALATHTGGCGAANHLIEHIREVAENPHIMEATRSLMLLVNSYNDYLETDYDENIAQEIQAKASAFTTKLVDDGWQKEQFTEAVRDRLPVDPNDPHAADFKKWEDELAEPPIYIEVLDEDSANPNRINSGHKEQGIVFVIGDKTLDKNLLEAYGLGEMFVITLEDSKNIARRLSKSDNRLYTKGIMSNIAFHLSIAHNLAKKNLPVYIIDTRKLL